MSRYITILFIINCAAAVHGIVLSIILWTRKKNRRANHVLAVLVFLFSIGMAGPFYFSNRFYLHVPALAPFFNALPYTFGPLLFLYVRALTHRRFTLTKIDGLHAVPAVLVLLYYSSLYFMPSAEKIALPEKIYFQQTVFSYTSIAAGLLQALIYVVLCFRLLRIHTRKIKESFSAVEKVNLSWVHHRVSIYIVIWAIACGLQAFPPGGPTAENPDVAIAYFLISLTLFSIGYRGMDQPEIFKGIPDYSPPKKNKKFEWTGLSREKGKQIKEDLLRVMEEKRLYLAPDLTLPQVAVVMDIPSHRLSQVINERMKQNFFQFINGYRVETAKGKLSRPGNEGDELTKIALDSGFNSLAAFNRVFKDITGESPSQFCKRFAKGGHAPRGAFGDQGALLKNRPLDPRKTSD